jgi:glucose/arabinose dehydrogenase
MRWRVIALCVAIAVGAACENKDDPPSSPGPDGTGEQITGNERIGWDQQAASPDELATFRYVVYVDGARTDLAGVSCGANATPAGFVCSARLPTMSPGNHTLQLASVSPNGDESPRSAPLLVRLMSTVAGVDPASAVTSEFTTADGARLRIDAVAQGLEDPTALAFAPDGRAFIGERAGRVRVVRNEQLEPDAALVLDDALVANGSGGLLALAVDPQFDRTRLVYTLHTVAGSDGAPMFRVTRFGEASGTLGERAVLLDGVPASVDRAAGSMAFGPDGKLYLAFGDAVGDARVASFTGKVLRLNPDGTTPEDQPGASPVYSIDHPSPRGFDWQPATGVLWVADVVRPGVEELRAIAPGTRPVRRGERQARQGYTLPANTGVSSLAFYRGASVAAFRGDLFVAAQEGRSLLRLRFDRRDPTRVVSTERLLQNRSDTIRLVAGGGDGALYVCTDRALVRIGPQ